jgi:hypothetical protein
MWLHYKQTFVSDWSCLGLFDTCPWHITARRMAQA